MSDETREISDERREVRCKVIKKLPNFYAQKNSISSLPIIAKYNNIIKNGWRGYSNLNRWPPCPPNITTREKTKLKKMAQKLFSLDSQNLNLGSFFILRLILP